MYYIGVMSDRLSKTRLCSTVSVCVCICGLPGPASLVWQEVKATLALNAVFLLLPHPAQTTVYTHSHKQN